jgi:hypothetical protein
MSTKSETKKKSKTKNADTAKQQSNENGKNAYELLSKAMSKDKEKYATEKFKDCWPIAKEISETLTNTVWDDAMKIMQDYPSTYAQTAAVCFFSFLCAAINAHLEEKCNKSVPESELPKVEPQEAKSEMIRILIKRSETECSTEGHILLKNLLERDFGYLMAILKALNIENNALHNLLISNFRFWVWDVMVPHLFLSEKKKEEAHA